MTKQISFYAMKKLLLFTLIFFGCNRAEEAKKWIDQARSKSFSDPSGAIADYSKAIQIDPDNYFPYWKIAQIKDYNLEDLRGAIEDYTMAIKLLEEMDNKSSFENLAHLLCYANRAHCKYELGDVDGACLDYSKGGALGYEECYEYIKERCN